MREQIEKTSPLSGIPSGEQQYFAEQRLWGADFVGRKLVLYPDKLKAVQGYENFRENLRPCKIVLLRDSGKKDCIRMVPANLDVETGSVYLPEAAFGSVWRQLEAGIREGLLASAKRGIPCAEKKPEDVVDLSNLRRENSTPYIKGNEICYRARELTPEERRLRGRKQSLLDNPRMNYYYSLRGGWVHDKECEAVKNIAAKDFCGSEELPEGRELCPKCRRSIYIRMACSPHTKQIPFCRRIFREQGINDMWLRHFVVTAGMKFYASSLEELRVTEREDTWLIQGRTPGSLKLLHNNYVRVSDTERYITEGFHDQGLSGRSLLQLLRYIENYTWEKHLGKEAARETAPGESEAVAAGERPKELEAAVRETPKEVEAVVTRERPKELETVVTRDTPKAVEAVVTRERPKKLEATVARKIVPGKSLAGTPAESQTDGGERRAWYRRILCWVRRLLRGGK